MGKRVKLSAEGYWKFRASINDARSVELEARDAVEAFKRKAAEAQQKTRELFAQLGKAHDFDPMLSYGWDDATCELIEIDPQT